MDTEFARDARHRLFAPLSLAAYLTWAAVTVSAVSSAALLRGDPGAWLGLASLLAMLGLFMLPASHLLDPCRHRVAVVGAVVMQGLLVLAAQHLLGYGGVAVLLIIVAAQLFTMMPLAAAVLAIVLLNALLAGLWL